MDNQTFEELAQFCADQYYRFDAGQWLEKAEQYRHVPIALAKYLSGTSWYGHSEQLDSISALVPSRMPDGRDSGGQEALDIARFSGIIRVRIAMMRDPAQNSALQASTQ